MRHVYLSFLGLGPKQGDGGHSYKPTIYTLDGAVSTQTPFVQAAEFEIIGGARFDQTIIVDTKKSHAVNYTRLEAALRRYGGHDIDAVTIDEEIMSPEKQWTWFESILSCIEPGDRLTVDLTHGYRAVPIIFSAAINFLQKSRNILLDAVYYGVYENKDEKGYAPIIDMKDFYTINEWADAVGRLVEDADGRKLAQVAENAPGFQFGELGEDGIVHALQQLTDSIRNVDVNRVAATAGGALAAIRSKEQRASGAGRMLCGLVIDKYTSLTSASPESQKYDSAYFQVQLALSRLLLEHRLFMQAYTVMRELIASLGMVGFEKEGMSASKRKQRRRNHAEVFVKLFQFSEDKWLFNKEEYKRNEPKNYGLFESVKPFYDELKRLGIENKIRNITGELALYRNGFDHAWTCRVKENEDIEDRARFFLNQLEDIVADIEKAGLMP